MIRITNIVIVIFVVSFSLLSCETVIHPTLESAEPVLVVDAWLTNRSETQVIILSKTQPYFDNSLPKGVKGASITVVDNHNNTFLFEESTSKSGYYEWTPATDEVIGYTGDQFQLKITVDGEIFNASSYMGNAPAVDSITFKKDKVFGIEDSVYVGEFWAKDPVGFGDTYWIKAYKNGNLLNKPAEMNLAYDASFSSGGEIDGVTFIPPIRQGINAQDVDADDKSLPPFESGDSINVQLFSISHEAFNYLNEVKTQTDRPGGFQELFANPLANVSTNIVNANTKGSKVVGFFNVSAVTSRGKKFIKP